MNTPSDLLYLVTTCRVLGKRTACNSLPPNRGHAEGSRDSGRSVRAGSSVRDSNLSPCLTGALPNLGGQSLILTHSLFVIDPFGVILDSLRNQTVLLLSRLINVMLCINFSGITGVSFHRYRFKG